ncbi:MAG: RNA-binding protein, partial [bacterium]|nr:RNA-binding protein [bacterium]
DSAAMAAISALDGQSMDGRNLSVNEAQDRPKRTGGGGGGFGGGSGGGYGGGSGGGRSGGDRGGRGW